MWCWSTIRATPLETLAAPEHVDPARRVLIAATLACSLAAGACISAGRAELAPRFDVIDKGSGTVISQRALLVPIYRQLSDIGISMSGISARPHYMGSPRAYVSGRR